MKGRGDISAITHSLLCLKQYTPYLKQCFSSVTRLTNEVNKEAQLKHRNHMKCVSFANLFEVTSIRTSTTTVSVIAGFCNSNS